MPTTHNRENACPAFEARLEDYLAGRLDAREASEVEVHIRSCARCAAAVEATQAGSRLLAAVRARLDAAEAAARPFFAARVMAAIRGEQRQRDLWKLVERVAWRVCWVATAAALVLALLLMRMPASPPAVSAQDQSQMQVLVNVPTAQPATQDDTFLLVASDGNGR